MLSQEWCCSMSWKMFNFKSVSSSWHIIPLVICKRSAWAFCSWAMALSPKGRMGTLQLTPQCWKKCLAFKYEFSFRGIVSYFLNNLCCHSSMLNITFCKFKRGMCANNNKMHKPILWNIGTFNLQSTNITFDQHEIAYYLSNDYWYFWS